MSCENKTIQESVNTNQGFGPDEELEITQQVIEDNTSQNEVIHTNSLTDSFTLVEIPDDASCFTYKILNSKNKEVSLPKYVKEGLDCPALLSLEENRFLYYWTDNVYRYDLNEKKNVKLFTPFKGIDGISNPVINGNLALFQIINQNGVGGYNDICRLLLLDLTYINDIKKRKFDRPVNFSCGGICSGIPYEDFGIKNQETIWFKRNINYEENPGAIIEINLNKKNRLTEFNLFIEKFRDYAINNNTKAFAKLNHSSYEMKDLLLTSLTDKEGLVHRKTSYNKETMQYEYEIYFKGESEDGYDFESGIYYYFTYSKENNSFYLIDMLAAG